MNLLIVFTLLNGKIQLFWDFSFALTQQRRERSEGVDQLPHI